MRVSTSGASSRVRLKKATTLCCCANMAPTASDSKGTVAGSSPTRGSPRRAYLRANVTRGAERGQKGGVPPPSPPPQTHWEKVRACAFFTVCTPGRFLPGSAARMRGSRTAR